MELSSNGCSGPSRVSGGHFFRQSFFLFFLVWEKRRQQWHVFFLFIESSWQSYLFPQTISLISGMQIPLTNIINYHSYNGITMINNNVKHFTSYKTFFFYEMPHFFSIFNYLIWNVDILLNHCLGDVTMILDKWIQLYYGHVHIFIFLYSCETWI